MKTYYQTDGATTLYDKNKECFKAMVEYEVDEYYKEKKNKAIDKIMEKVKNGEVVNFNGFKFGTKEMKEEEYNSLGEFTGW